MVSIVVPVYNSRGYLNRCLDSILSQTYADIEVVVVDDGSTDGSNNICLEYAGKDKRLKYFRQENAGVSIARNKGIKESSGAYICFVDSDDYVDTDYVAVMMTAIEKSGADIVIQGLKQIKDNLILSTETFEEGVFDVSNLSEIQFDKIFYYCGPYCKLFKASVIRKQGISFPSDIEYGEDAVFYHTYLANCKVIHMLPDMSYNYRIANPGALSTKVLPPDQFWKNQSNRRRAYMWLKEKYSLPLTISQKEESCKLTGVTGMLNSVFRACKDDASVARYIELILNDSDFRFDEMVGLTIKSKIILRLIKSNSSLSRWILKKIYQ